MKLDAHLSERMQALANSRHSSADAVVTGAIENYVRSAQQRSGFVEKAVKAQGHFAETGLHFTSAELTFWLESWGTPDEAEAPKCHT